MQLGKTTSHSSFGNLLFSILRSMALASRTPQRAMVPPITAVPGSPLSSSGADGQELGAVATRWPSYDEQCTAHGCFPRLFILGTQKGGTSSLAVALQKHGTVCFSNPERTGAWNAETQNEKEPHVFSELNASTWRGMLRRPDQYSRLFQPADCPLRHFVDATPAYLRSAQAPGRLALIAPPALRPQLRMVAIIREPIARDLSWFNHKLASVADLGGAFCEGCPTDQVDFCAPAAPGRPGPTYEAETLCRKQELDGCLASGAAGARGLMALNLTTTAEACVPRASARTDFIEHCDRYWSCVGASGARDVAQLAWGFYAPQLRAWWTHVARSSVFVVDFERLVTEEDDMVGRIAAFYGLPPLASARLGRDNAKESRFKVEVVACSTRSLLEQLYHPWNDFLVESLRDPLWRGAGHEPPPHEPRFDGFTSVVPCDEQERTNLTRLSRRERGK